MDGSAGARVPAPVRRHRGAVRAQALSPDQAKGAGGGWDKWAMLELSTASRSSSRSSSTSPYSRIIRAPPTSTSPLPRREGGEPGTHLRTHGRSGAAAGQQARPRRQLRQRGHLRRLPGAQSLRPAVRRRVRQAQGARRDRRLYLLGYSLIGSFAGFSPATLSTTSSCVPSSPTARPIRSSPTTTRGASHHLRTTRHRRLTPAETAVRASADKGPAGRPPPRAASRRSYLGEPRVVHGPGGGAKQADGGGREQSASPGRGCGFRRPLPSDDDPDAPEAGKLRRRAAQTSGLLKRAIEAQAGESASRVRESRERPPARHVSGGTIAKDPVDRPLHAQEDARPGGESSGRSVPSRTEPIHRALKT